MWNLNSKCWVFWEPVSNFIVSACTVIMYATYVPPAAWLNRGSLALYKITVLDSTSSMYNNVTHVRIRIHTVIYRQSYVHVPPLIYPSSPTYSLKYCVGPVAVKFLVTASSGGVPSTSQLLAWYCASIGLVTSRRGHVMEIKFNIPLRIPELCPQRGNWSLQQRGHKSEWLLYSWLFCNLNFS